MKRHSMLGPGYRVKQGDLLSSIAQGHLGQASRWPRIMSYNNRRDVVQITGRALTDPNRLREPIARQTRSSEPGQSGLFRQLVPRAPLPQVLLLAKA